MNEGVTEAVSSSIWSHLLTVGGFMLAIFAIARLMSDKRQPGNTIAWLLGIVLVPYVGVPLFLFLGGRKIKRLAALKTRVNPDLPDMTAASEQTRDRPSVQAMCANGAPLPVGGNAVTLITDGQQAFAELEKCINAAQHSIHIATFILGREAVGKRLVRLLVKRAKAGIKVRLQLDAFGSFFTAPGLLRELRAAGGEVVKFLPVLPLATRASANLRNHRKIAVFDQHVAIVGGHNLSQDYLGPTPRKKRFADFGAIIEGPAAALLNEVFLADWSFASKQPIETLRSERDPTAIRPAGKGDIQIVASGPDVQGDPLYEGILALIQEAEESIWIVTPYFIPDEVLQRSLLVKARAGKDVTLIIPAKSNHPITDFARRHYLRELHQAGAHILFYQPGMLHSKAMIVDHCAGVFGSANFDLRSLFVNFEIGVVAHSTADVKAMRRWAEEIRGQSTEYIPGQPRRYRLLGNLAEDLSRLFAPLL